MHLNHPETMEIPTWSLEKVSPMKPIPCASKVGGCFSKEFTYIIKNSFNSHNNSIIKIVILIL